MFYKVVCAQQHKLVSACTKNPCKVRYMLNQWTKPHYKLPNSKLFIFGFLDDAQNYVWDNSSTEKSRIYECIAKNPVPCTETKLFPLWAFYMSKQYDRNSISKGFIEYWKDKNSQQLFKLSQVDVPNGTFWCDEVMITKRVK